VKWLLVSIFSIALIAAVPAWRHYYPVIAASGWNYVVYLDDVKRASALALDEKGILYISQEMKDHNGSILQRDPDGRTSVLTNGLSKPDGLVAFQGGIVFSQEQGRQSVQWTDGNIEVPLFEANSVEGLATDGYYLFAIEDVKDNGRLLRYDPQSHDLVVLRVGLQEAESVAVCPNGELYYAEKNKPYVMRFQSSGEDTIVIDQLRNPGMLLCDERGLWVTEDSTHMARVLLLSHTGEVEVVLSHLRAAQTILRTSAGRYLVSEQGRNRILQVQKEIPELNLVYN